jgi:2-oxoglutarate dehydrogenase E2 component (dihydrolipoamide succinyltransferase)
MATVVRMPQLGESVVEGTVARWLKAPGETIDKFEPLLEISTDKIDTEIPAPAAGMLLAIVAAEGETVAVGGPLAHIGEPGELVNEPTDGHTATATVAKMAATPSAVPDQRAVPDQHAVAEKPQGRDFISPVVARIAREHKVDLSAVSGTGLGGRITKKDLLAFVAQRSRPDDRQLTTDGYTHQQGLREQEPTPKSQPLTADETLQPLSAMRRAIAQHMALSVQTSPHVTTVYEVDMTAVVRHREATRQRFAEKGVSLTYTPYFVAAVAAALRAVPPANSRFTDAGIVLNRRIHIGVAVALADGLIVPVLRDADERNLQGLARAVNDLATAARKGQLAADATRGGTFTITNHGVTGSLLGTPIINQPQSGILGIGTIAKRAVVRSASASLLPSADDALVIRPTCYLSFSFDHRVLDGATADAFLSIVKNYLENYPAAD